MTIADYLTEHLIHNNIITLPEYLYSEVIVDEPKEFARIILENGCYICSILWWEYARIGGSPQLGYGGFRDPRNPNEHFFSETDICDVFLESSTLRDYWGYMDGIWRKYSHIPLFPAFDISRKPD